MYVSLSVCVCVCVCYIVCVYFYTSVVCTVSKDERELFLHDPHAIEIHLTTTAKLVVDMDVRKLQNS